MRRVIASIRGYLSEMEEDIRVPAEFLAALTANESGGDTHAKRFEPGVYEHLKRVAAGQVTSYGSIVKSLLEKEIERESQAQAADHHEAQPAAAAGVAEAANHTAAQATAATDAQSDQHPGSPAAAKAESYHTQHLTADFAAASAPALSALEDAAIRRLATSWGLTQIMGYHMLGRPEPVEKLCDPAFHYRLAARMIEDFAARFRLDPRRDFEPLFRCWNTGRPDGKTFDPAYAENGMRRIEICRPLLAAPGVSLAAEAEPGSTLAAAAPSPGADPENSGAPRPAR